jgi:hypothetical protein
LGGDDETQWDDDDPRNFLCVPHRSKDCTIRKWIEKGFLVLPTIMKGETDDAPNFSRLEQLGLDHYHNLP